VERALWLICLPSGKVSDHLANERTYLAWMRTGIAIIALGFVVARFGVALREINPSIPPTSPVHFTAVIGIVLVLVGGCMILLALRIFINNQNKIRLGKYVPTSTVETIFSLAFFIFAILLIVYLLWNL